VEVIFKHFLLKLLEIVGLVDLKYLQLLFAGLELV